LKDQARRKWEFVGIGKAAGGINAEKQIRVAQSGICLQG